MGLALIKFEEYATVLIFLFFHLTRYFNGKTWEFLILQMISEERMNRVDEVVYAFEFSPGNLSSEKDDS